MVQSENSESSQARMINNIETSVPTIGDSHDSLMDFRLYEHGYSSDIFKCYLRVPAIELTSGLRLMV